MAPRANWKGYLRLSLVDGRRRDRDERAGQRLGVYGAPAERRVTH
jgi:hypothetical protein